MMSAPRRASAVVYRGSSACIPIRRPSPRPASWLLWSACLSLYFLSASPAEGQVPRRVTFDVSTLAVDRRFLPAGELFELTAPASRELLAVQATAYPVGEPSKPVRVVGWNRPRSMPARSVVLAVDPLARGTDYRFTIVSERRLRGDQLRRFEEELVLDLQDNLGSLEVIEGTPVVTPLREVLIAGSLAESIAIDSTERIVAASGSPFGADTASDSALTGLLERRKIDMILADRLKLAADVESAEAQLERRHRELVQGPLTRSTLNQVATAMEETRGSRELRSRLSVAMDLDGRIGLPEDQPHELWDIQAITRRIAAIDAYRASLVDVRNLFRDLRLSRYRPVTEGIEPGDLQYLGEEFTRLDGAASATRGKLASLGNKLEEYADATRRFAQDLRRRAEEDITIVRRDSVVYSSEPVPAAYVIAFGLLAAPELTEIVPHAAVHFRPVSGCFPPAGFWQEVGCRLSVSFGLTLASIAEEGSRENLFWFTTLTGGAAFRIVGPVRFGGGVMLFKSIEQDGSRELALEGFVVLSVFEF
jgi:hypothetical protein